MGGKVHMFVTTLKRDAPDLPWGLRLVGGSDIDTPLIITRVNPGTPAQRELLRGDIITKIDDYDARDLRHEDAQNLFRNAGNNIRLAIQRDASINRGPSAMSNGSSRCSSAMLNSPCPQPYMPPSSPYNGSPVPSGPSPMFRNAMATPVAHLPTTVFPPELPYMGMSPYQLSTPASTLGRKSPGLFSPVGYREEFADEGESIVNQPYRTTPLVLPGAKVKKEAGPTESYLRHHPNPAMRAAPHHDHDVLMKQRVADTMLQRVAGEEAAVKYAHKQFNSPLGLYSDANIVETIKRDTNTVPYKKTVLYNPANSETYKALQEDSLGDVIQEVPVPVQMKVFHAPTARTGPIKKPMPQQQQQQQQKNTTYVSSLNDETIQQSHSFKRLMYHVLGDN
ncbi:PDZ_signaling and DUF4749 domain-containing protein Zasp66 isoform X2 [Arctopsyche grandis]|uniref:PDZ_signaling and DUF4749 domain-containing protein Zasp66 isoform X2 n=1 Tax=Arctopsyche grandis TaxID=121162 RepID=UPI00406D78F9